MVTHSGFHCWRNAKGLVNPAEVVVHEIEGNHVLMVFKLLGESIGQASEASHLHSHSKILSLHKASGDMPRIGLADDWRGHCSDALRTAVPSLALCSIIPVELDKHCIIYFRTESTLDRIQVNAVTVGGQLNPMGQTGSQVGDEVVGAMRRPSTYQPAGDEFRVRTERRPRPHISISRLATKLFRQVLFFRVAKRPDFIALDSLTRQVAKGLVLIFQARLTSIGQELDYGVLCHASHTNCGPNRVPLYKARYCLGATFFVQAVHTDHYA